MIAQACSAGHFRAFVHRPADSAAGFCALVLAQFPDSLNTFSYTDEEAFICGVEASEVTNNSWEHATERRTFFAGSLGVAASALAGGAIAQGPKPAAKLAPEFVVGAILKKIADVQGVVGSVARIA